MKLKGPNIGCLSCVTKHAANATHARLYIFFPISHAYYPVDLLGEEWLVKF